MLVIERITSDGSPCSPFSSNSIAILSPTSSSPLLPPTSSNVFEWFEEISEKREEARFVPLLDERKNFPPWKVLGDEPVTPSTLQLSAPALSAPFLYKEDTLPSRNVFAPGQSQCLSPCSLHGSTWRN